MAITHSVSIDTAVARARRVDREGAMEVMLAGVPYGNLTACSSVGVYYEADRGK